MFTNKYMSHATEAAGIEVFYDPKQEVKVILQKAPHRGPIPRLGIPWVGFPISVP